MRNVTGSPVEDEDFFNRPRDLEGLQRNLRNGADSLLTAPRRVGKTSLVLRLCEIERAAGRCAVFANVEGCADELAFAEKLIDELRQTSLQPEPLSRLSLAVRSFRKALSGTKVGAAGVDVELASSDDADHGTLGRAVESIFRKIEEGQTPVVIAIDEMPELLLALSRGEDGTQRVGRLLHWLRSLRQTHRKNIRWIFLGSIGLDSFVDDRSLRKTINDLTSVHLDALTVGEAHEFLERLGESNGLLLPPEARQRVIDRIGWPLPHHLQIVFHALVDSGAKTVDDAAIAAAFDHLLQPGNLGQFDTWRQRLDEQFEVSDATAAKDILRHLCQHAEGRERHQILSALIAARPAADPSTVEEKLSRLLQVLLRDGYLLESGGRYTFRSFLLREYWHRREVR